MADITLQWIHGAISLESFEKLLKKAFYFIKTRESKVVPNQSYGEVSNRQYVEKIQKRFDDLKKNDLFRTLDDFVKHGTKFDSREQIYDKYFELYHSISGKPKNDTLVIGHGDLCFSNMLYDESMNILKFIDPLGALNKDDAWIIPSYDLAKLSHSICGNYDFINSDRYKIECR